MAILRVDPFDCQMPFPLDTRMQQPTLNARDGIPMNARWVGMICWVQSENSLYILTGGIANTNWQQLWPLGSAGVAVQNVTVNTNVPTSQGVNGDIWFRQNGGEIEVYQKTAGLWVNKGAITTGAEASPKSKLTISGITTISWASIATDENGNPDAQGRSYAALYGAYPRSVTCYVPDGTGIETIVALTTDKLSNGNIRINADGLTDVVVIIS